MTELSSDLSIARRPRFERLAVRSAIAVLVAAGCVSCATAHSPSPAVPFRTPRTATVDEVLAAYDGYCKGIETLSASGELEVRDLRANRTRRLGMRILAGRGGRLYVKGSVAVVTALELVSDGQRFWFQVPSKKTVWTGETGADATPVEGEGVPYRALRPEDVTASLLPEPLEVGGDEQIRLEADHEAFSISVSRAGERRGVVRRRVWLDRETLRPVRLRSYDDTGELERQTVLGAWADDGPRRIEISRPAQGYQAVMDLEKVQRNPALPEKAFAPRTPQGYSVVEVKD